MKVRTWLVVVAAVLVCACGSTSKLGSGSANPDIGVANGSTNNGAIYGNMAVVFNANFTDPIGSLSTINIDDPTNVLLARVTTDGSDAIVRSFGQRIYVVNRMGTDTVQVIDPANFEVIANYSVGKGSNPQDILVVSDEKAYVSRLDAQNDTADPSDVLIINPLTGERLGGFDLKPYTADDGERLARAAQMTYANGTLFVCMQDLPGNMMESANTNGKVAMINVDEDTLIDANEDQDGIQIITLAGRNPSDIAYMPDTNKLIVADTGVYENFVVNTLDSNGGIEFVNLDTYTTEGIFIDDATLGGGVAEIRLASETLAFTIINSMTIVSFDPSTGLVVLPNVYTTAGFFLPDFAIDQTGNMHIAEQDVNNPGIVIINPVDGVKVAGPIGVGAPPVSITFVDAE